MSDAKGEFICPNCGFHATDNYCAHCGQETHLHKETFWGLVTHFIGHYFHYDSKFWQTIKALWFSPGKLTLAYWNKQRMRYIPPVSLYIFISAVYFLVSLNTKSDIKYNVTAGWPPKGFATSDSSKADDVFIKDADAKKVSDFVEKKTKLINAKYGNVSDFIKEKVNHVLPKIFFFMIPFLGLLLKLVFFRRKDIFFVDHAIFALHYHALWFSLFIPAELNLPDGIASSLDLILVALAAYYFVAALRNVYNISWGKSILNALVLSTGYLIFLSIIFSATLLLIVMLA